LVEISSVLLEKMIEIWWTHWRRTPSDDKSN
jgi:hypothetical protein